MVINGSSTLVDSTRLRDARGDSYMSSVPADARRATGEVYTPEWLVDEMVERARVFGEPVAVVDCGAGSGRFSIAAAKAFPEAMVYAVEKSPQACAMCSANIHDAGLANRVRVENSDFFDFQRPISGPGVLWIGNPPYVRHHDIARSEKERFKDGCTALGHPSSGLAGLHIHFLEKVAELWEDGDAGIFVTSAEWLDVNYGELPRWLLTEKLHVRSIRLFDRDVQVFPGTDTTAVVFSFGGKRLHDVVEVAGDGVETADLPIKRFRSSDRWSDILLGIERVSGGAQRLGSIARVHRGVVTGNNRFWVRSKDDLAGVPEAFTVPVVCHARELMGDDPDALHPQRLKRLIALPANSDGLSDSEKRAMKGIIAEARENGIDKGYVASHRSPWWSVKPPEPPAVFMTYMARRPPVFLVNSAHVAMLNVVHGIYPISQMSQKGAAELAERLNESSTTNGGRAYCGGLVKFEPGEAERIVLGPVLEEAVL